MWFSRRPRRPHIRLVASCDRYNYGDLLFPILTRWSLSACEEIAARYGFEQYGLVSSDLSRYGAQPSRGMADLYRDAGAGDVILLAGGENLAQTWFDMHLTLLGPRDAAERRRFAERAEAEATEVASRRALRCRHQFPYILPPEAFRGGVRVMYNSVGGWPLAHYPEGQQRTIVETMRQASFVSVRDSHTAAILRGLDPAMPVFEAPDCVFLLPEMWPREHLGAMASPEVRRLVAESEGFVCFQCHSRYGNANRDELKRQLRALAGESGLDIVLVPTARIHSFESHTFLSSLALELGPRIHLLPDTATVSDIAYVFASARLFCGTGLHASITTLAYGSPLVPLATDDPKLRFNVESWGQAAQFPMTAAADLCSQALRCLALDRRAVQETALRLRDAARGNLGHLADVILEGQFTGRTASLARSTASG